jgi:hypothetical protein
MLKKPATLSLYGIILLVSLCAARGQEAGQSSVTMAANSVVQEVLARAGAPSSLAVSFQNVSQVPGDLQEAVQNAIFAGLGNAGVRVVKPEMAVAEVKIIFSEDWQGYVLIAMIHQGPSQQLVMKRFARAERSVASRAPVLTLRKNTVWQQDEPILDFYTDNQNLVVLEPTEVAMYSNDSGQWRQRYTLAINHSQTWPRDLRGRLHISGFQMTASLPGTLCSGSLSPPSLDCRASDDPWPLEAGQLVAFYSARRNFFNGILAGPSAGASVIAFFSGATWPLGDQRQWLFTGTDGHARLYQRDLSAPAAVFNGWGSNLAVIHSGCGSGWQVLASAPTDNIHPDALQALEAAGRDLLPVSAAVDLAGAVSAMWTSGKNSESVNAVMQSPATGKYEAIVLTVSCN